MSTPDLHLNTCFVLNDARRIVSTREPQGTRGPLFVLVRGLSSCVWAVRADVPDDVAVKLDRLARDETPGTDFRHVPVHTDRYVALLRDRIEQVPEAKMRESDGPAFEFPDSLVAQRDVIEIDDERLLEPNFRGWVPRRNSSGLFSAARNRRKRSPGQHLLLRASLGSCSRSGC